MNDNDKTVLSAVFANDNPEKELFCKQTILGKINLQALNDSAIKSIYEWVTCEYASFWGMMDCSYEEVYDFYHGLEENQHHQALMGYIDGKASFLIELYNPAKDAVGECYNVRPTDLGMHILVAPSNGQHIKDYTFTIFSYVMDYMFSFDRVDRIVVEPDASNHKIHQLNKRAGFQHVREVQFMQSGKMKTALLGFCTRQQHMTSKNVPVNRTLSPLVQDAELATVSLTPEIWSYVNRHQVKKCLSELAHERIVQPKKETTLDNGWAEYSLSSQTHLVSYTYNAKLLPLEHWLIDPQSIVKRTHDDESGQATEQSIDALNFIIEFNDVLQIPQDKLAIYLEEISATLTSAAYKCLYKNISVKTLVDTDFQSIEAAMTEGHPAFIANNGRIGFDAIDFRQYAPEAGKPIQLVFLAAHKNRAEFNSCDDLNYQQLIEQEFDKKTHQHWKNIIEQKGANPDDYLVFPVHPWQWFNKLAHVFSSEIANQYLIPLGYSDDCYQAQQSIRTFFNLTDSKKFYVKTALSVLNMGFMRGLSAHYMKSTPAINDWLKTLVDQDEYLNQYGFKILREIASIGYSNPYYEDKAMGNTPYKKMLAALWRENPQSMIGDNQSLMTMAALLHIDHDGQSMLGELIERSKLSAKEWVDQYLNAYLKPLLHCYYQYQLVYMPHGENIILVMEDYVPQSIFMKDIGEEIYILNSDIELPEKVKRISIEVPPSHELLSFFTDVFDGVFRYIAAILDDVDGFSAQAFWERVAYCIDEYEQQHPELTQRFEERNLFQADFEHSCLNRLQLANNLQMVDLSDPSEALKFAGRLDNPIAPFANKANVA